MQVPQYIFTKAGVSTNSIELRNNQQKLLQYFFSYLQDRAIKKTCKNQNTLHVTLTNIFKINRYNQLIANSLKKRIHVFQPQDSMQILVPGKKYRRK